MSYCESRIQKVTIDLPLTKALQKISSKGKKRTLILTVFGWNWRNLGFDILISYKICFQIEVSSFPAISFLSSLMIVEKQYNLREIFGRKSPFGFNWRIFTLGRLSKDIFLTVHATKNPIWYPDSWWKKNFSQKNWKCLSLDGTLRQQQQ